jgi:hypothetical protein
MVDDAGLAFVEASLEDGKPMEEFDHLDVA